ncbi:MAG: PIN domain-containing protein [Novosphingobium sp.]
MPILIDTDVAIHLRDGSPPIMERIAVLDEIPAMSIVTLVELEAGAANDARRAALLERLCQTIPVLAFDRSEARAYGAIVARLGYDRRRVLDRMIAAQAIVAGRRLITINGRDFSAIDGLQLEVWAAPGD